MHLIQVELNSLERDVEDDSESKERLLIARHKLAEIEEALGPLKLKFELERDSHDKLIAAKRKLDELEIKAQDAERRYETATG